jgi:hypothetical protein
MVVSALVAVACVQSPPRFGRDGRRAQHNPRTEKDKSRQEKGDECQKACVKGYEKI